MSIEHFVRRNWLASLLVGLHAVLVFAWTWIELDDAWNDMNPTMLVWSAFFVVDYPIHWVLNSWIDSVQQTGTYLAAILVLGSIYWFAVGSLAACACHGLHRLWLGHRPAHNGI